MKMALRHVEFPAHFARVDDRHAHDELAFDLGALDLVDLIDQFIVPGQHPGVRFLVEELAAECGQPPLNVIVLPGGDDLRQRQCEREWQVPHVLLHYRIN
jgi:hypothetical protein